MDTVFYQCEFCHGMLSVNRKKLERVHSGHLRSCANYETLKRKNGRRALRLLQISLSSSFDMEVAAGEAADESFYDLLEWNGNDDDLRNARQDELDQKYMARDGHIGAGMPADPSLSLITNHNFSDCAGNELLLLIKKIGKISLNIPKSLCFENVGY